MNKNTFKLRFLRTFGTGLMITIALTSCERQQHELPVDIERGVSLELAQHRASIISGLNYRLAFHIPAEHDAEIAASVSIDFDLSDNAEPLQLDFREDAGNVAAVTANGRESAYQFRQEHIIVPPSELQVGRNTVDIEFIAGSSSLNRNPEYLYTLFVPDRARTAFILFDQPDLKATFELTLNIPAGWEAMANAPVKSIEKSAGRAEYRFERSDLIPSYLFSFVAGKFESVTQERNGQAMTMLHRETDAKKVTRNVDAIFDLHAASIEWLEQYTGIDYPYKKFGFALIPSFQYGGMEHVGAIQYRASGLFLDEDPSDTELLSRAGLIAHETAHMWFGNLVTMEWFNDVWTKEVLANFMAAKIVNPSFPDIDHDLNFLVDLYPGAYGVDRSEGANPIRQELHNLNEAGQMYGAIIYNKAPIMMRQLELIVGKDRFREGMQEYLSRFEFANATWPDLIQILDGKTVVNLIDWSEVWVNTPGRPEFEVRYEVETNGEATHVLLQHDPAGLDRVWPQRFSLRGSEVSEIDSAIIATAFDDPADGTTAPLLFNADGFGYGLFPADLRNLDRWTELSAVEKGSELINIFNNILSGSNLDVVDYFLALLGIIETEQNQLLLNLALNQASRIYISLLTPGQQQGYIAELEEVLWRTMSAQQESSKVKLFFKAFAKNASSPAQLQKVYKVWAQELEIDRLTLSENDYIELAETLAIRLPDLAQDIIERQHADIENPDNRRRLEFVAPSLSPDIEIRDEFFALLADEANRQTESWVVDALYYLHHPSRSAQSEKYVLPSLQLLQEIQMTGDIFFPTRWLSATLANHRSTTTVETVRTFLQQRPEYNAQLRMKILQQADMLFRANRITAAATTSAIDQDSLN
jgi:aminopeptidase N